MYLREVKVNIMEVGFGCVGSVFGLGRHNNNTRTAKHTNLKIKYKKCHDI